MIIAMDGPAASGKGTLGRKLAEKFDLAYLDTGALYRAVGLSLKRAGHGPEDADRAAHAAKTLDSDLLNDPELRSEQVGHMASIIAANPVVRANLLAFQRDFAHQPPSGKAGAVLDGRDIGTVVCPDAHVKLYVSASDPVRARRRLHELQAKGVATDYETVLADLLERDRRDSQRATAPLKPAQDAVLLDTTELDIESAFERACQIVDQWQRS
ncbi:cytidylate kinase [Iodidimonas muriae]|uniref:Cytidylate kinase n=1 Tax=Iodidimonas muriae TaxID=261467 RepID=A0ABQ2LAG6_9PROT|nr:(d)CMP kinase [Iodidimonas muriae]GER06194.1 cytidylate kinase [Kordiimonadales bacterium JCM 17843]GGO08610.1 cytidylate kinase [Iodidimonas muriae]